MTSRNNQEIIDTLDTEFLQHLSRIDSPVEDTQSYTFEVVQYVKVTGTVTIWAGGLAEAWERFADDASNYDVDYSYSGGEYRILGTVFLAEMK